MLRAAPAATTREDLDTQDVAANYLGSQDVAAEDLAHDDYDMFDNDRPRYHDDDHDNDVVDHDDVNRTRDDDQHEHLQHDVDLNVDLNVDDHAGDDNHDVRAGDDDHHRPGDNDDRHGSGDHDHHDGSRDNDDDDNCSRIVLVDDYCADDDNDERDDHDDEAVVVAVRPSRRTRRGDGTGGRSPGGTWIHWLRGSWRRPRARSTFEVSATWAGEFLDGEWYYESAVAPVEARPEPWRTHRLASRCWLFPRGLLQALGQPERFLAIGRDRERIALIRESLVAEGLRQPLVLVIDDQGHIVLRDGHHRLLASEGLGDFEWMPAYFRQSPGATVASTKIADVLETLLQDAVRIVP